VYVFGGCDDWLRENQREYYKKVILQTQPTRGRAPKLVCKIYEVA